MHSTVGLNAIVIPIGGFVWMYRFYRLIIPMALCWLMFFSCLVHLYLSYICAYKCARTDHQMYHRRRFVPKNSPLRVFFGFSKTQLQTSISFFCEGIIHYSHICILIAESALQAHVFQILIGPLDR